MNVEFHPEAAAEVIEAYQWYFERSENAADRFQKELDRAIEYIGDYPDRYARHDHGTRVFLLRRFPYLVIYKEYDEQIIVIAVAHDKRKPGYGRRRLKN